MKKLMCVLLILCAVLCACAQQGENNAEQPENQPEEKFEADKVYAAELEMYGEIASGEKKYDDFEEGTLPNIVRFDTDIGYQFKDVDGDGKEELIIAGMNDDITYAMYTSDNGEVKLVFISGERDRFYLLKDAEVYEEGSSGATSSIVALYSFENGELVEKEKYQSDADSSDEFYEKMTDLSERCEEKIEKLELTKIAE